MDNQAHTVPTEKDIFFFLFLLIGQGCKSSWTSLDVILAQTQARIPASEHILILLWSMEFVQRCTMLPDMSSDMQDPYSLNQFLNKKKKRHYFFNITPDTKITNRHQTEQCCLWVRPLDLGPGYEEAERARHTLQLLAHISVEHMLNWHHFLQLRSRNHVVLRHCCQSSIIRKYARSDSPAERPGGVSSTAKRPLYSCPRPC